MEQSFKRNLYALDRIFGFVGRFIDDNGIDESVSFSINLAVEEIFTNMVKYNTGSREDITIRIDVDNGAIMVVLIDRDVDPFDPDSVGEVDIQQSVEERTPGGLGLRLVTSVVDKLSYDYANREMKVTMIKNLE